MLIKAGGTTLNVTAIKLIQVEYKEKIVSKMVGLLKVLKRRRSRMMQFYAIRT